MHPVGIDPTSAPASRSCPGATPEISRWRQPPDRVLWIIPPRQGRWRCRRLRGDSSTLPGRRCGFTVRPRSTLSPSLLPVSIAMYAKAADAVAPRLLCTLSASIPLQRPCRDLVPEGPQRLAGGVSHRARCPKSFRPGRGGGNIRVYATILAPLPGRCPLAAAFRWSAPPVSNFWRAYRLLMPSANVGVKRKTLWLAT